MTIRYKVVNGKLPEGASVTDSFSVYIARQDAVRFNRDYNTDEYRVYGVDSKDGRTWLEYEKYDIKSQTRQGCGDE